MAAGDNSENIASSHEDTQGISSSSTPHVMVEDKLCYTNWRLLAQKVTSNIFFFHFNLHSILYMASFST